MNVPEKHRAIAHAWVDGAEVEYYSNDRWLNDGGDGGRWRSVGNAPYWYPNFEYRIKPKAKVKKWRWVFRYSHTGELLVTESHLSEYEAKISSTILQKIDSTMIEVDK